MIVDMNTVWQEREAQRCERAQERAMVDDDAELGWQLPRPDEDTVASWFAHLPQDEMPAQTADDIAAGLDDILAELRAGTLTPLVAGTENDEAEPVGYAERYG